MEQLKAFARRDWGEVLAAAILAITVFSFLWSPRAASEIVGLTVGALEPDYFRGGSGPWLALVGGIVAGAVAKRWIMAAIGIGIATMVVLLAGANIAGNEAEIGMTIWGITLTVCMIAALARQARVRIAKMGVVSAHQKPPPE